jgi:hypothetical protein
MAAITTATNIWSETAKEIRLEEFSVNGGLIIK